MSDSFITALFLSHILIFLSGIFIGRLGRKRRLDDSVAALEAKTDGKLDDVREELRALREQ